MTEGGITLGLNPAIEPRTRAGWVNLAERGLISLPRASDDAAFNTADCGRDVIFVVRRPNGGLFLKGSIPTAFS